MNYAVEAEGLQCDKGSFRLGPCSFAVGPRARVAIVGPSGSGKSTLLRCLAGLDRANKGVIRVHGQVVRDDHGAMSPDRRGLGFVFQDGALWPHMTASQHLRFAAPGLSQEQSCAMLSRGGIGHVADRRPAEMSGGEAQRLGLMRALAAEPRVLLLDEPLRSVDVHQRDALVLLVRELADERGIATILVTHDRDEALALADEILVMHGGRIVEHGPATTLLQSPGTAFAAAFLGGAACLPVDASRDGFVATAFGETNARGEAKMLRLVLMPGDLIAVPPSGDGPRARAIASVPHEDGYRIRAALLGQIVLAQAATCIRPGEEVELRLRRPLRVLPWTTANAQ